LFYLAEDLAVAGEKWGGAVNKFIDIIVLTIFKLDQTGCTLGNNGIPLLIAHFGTFRRASKRLYLITSLIME